MISKSSSDIRNETITALLTLLPNLDLTDGSPERDMFIEAPLAGQLSTLWENIIYSAKLHAPHTYQSDIEDADLINYMSNYGISQHPATSAYGVATFYVNTAPTQDIIIPDGTVIATQDSIPVEFTVQGSYTMYFSIYTSYFNANTQRYEINCSVKSLLSGSSYRAGANTIKNITTGISGISGVTNANPITGGQDEESVVDALSRVISTFQGRGLGPTQGLVNFILPYVEAVNVVGANDPEMLRDEGLGGMIDFYVIGEDLISTADTTVITSTGLSTGTNVTYTSTGIILLKQPVKSVLSVIVNTIVISPVYYTLTTDTGILSKSTQASDKITVTSTGLANGFWFKANDTVEITYQYNNLLATIETDLNSLENHYQNRDYLLREMTEVTIAVYMRIKETAGQDFTLVSTDVGTAVSSFINSIKNGGSLELADVVGTAKAITTVDNIDLTTVSLTPTGGGTKTAQGDILFAKNEYPVAGAITIVRWTN
jgi:uncharacterized phage protein gp47/JayE